MRVINTDVTQALGQIANDPAMLALFLRDSECALKQMDIHLESEDLQQLHAWVEALKSRSALLQDRLSLVLRSADRGVQA